MKLLGVFGKVASQYLTKPAVLNFRLFSRTNTRQESVYDYHEDAASENRLDEKSAELKAAETKAMDNQRKKIMVEVRKRGMLENGLLLSHFIEQIIGKMDSEEMGSFSQLLDKTKDAWDIYYWATGIKKCPPEYEDETMKMIKEHCKTINKEIKIKF